METETQISMDLYEHYSDVIMSTIASKITSIFIVQA